MDALSFSTCVDVTTSRGVIVYTYRWRVESANTYAKSRGAELAGFRGEAGKYSLSPTSMLRAARLEKIVLPSPKYAASQGMPITVIACGQRWPDGSLRPAVEDFTAAGAIIAELPGACSSKAVAAAGIWKTVCHDLGQFLALCTSGRELIERGFEYDVQLAGEVNASAAVPILHHGAFVDAATESNS